MKANLCKTRFSHTIIKNTSLTVAIITLSGTSISANSPQLNYTIQSTAVFSGTIQLPNNNPNFNQSTTRVSTDSSGAYYRNLGTATKPKLVLVYKSKYVKSAKNANGSISYFVDFKGIPVISLNAIISSPVLSGGCIKPYAYQGQVKGTHFQGVVQDEFNFVAAFYYGTVTDPKTHNKYTGLFKLYGYGPRYSDPNGGATPTVFDFKSDIPGGPTIKSLSVTNAPITNFNIQSATSPPSGVTNSCP